MSHHLPVATLTTDVLPPLYARWVDSFLAAPLPREPYATCDDCAMLADDDTTAHGAYTFSPATKCCTYLPELPNYLVGAIVRERTTPGAVSVEARIARGMGVSPLGLLQSERFKILFGNTVEGFGRSVSLRCPHYLEANGGRCGIWAHREATCATWYCKHARGAVAKQWWNRLYQLLKAAENALMRHCLIALDVGDEALAFQYPVRSPRDGREPLGMAEVEDQPDPGSYALMWGKWHGRERAFYEASTDLVDAMSWEDVLSTGGAELRSLARITAGAHQGVMHPEISARLRVGSFQVIALSAATCRVQSYSFLDPLDLPRPLFDVLDCFDGRPVSEAVALATARLGEPLEPASVQRLVDFRILVETAG